MTHKYNDILDHSNIYSMGKKTQEMFFEIKRLCYDKSWRYNTRHKNYAQR